MARLLLLLALWSAASASPAKTLAFPGADGFGRYAEGGRGGKVLVVSSLADHPGDPRPGTLRHAVQMQGARTVVFSVAGVIHLKSRLRVSNGRLTIAGQTAPGGIAVTGGPFEIVGVDDIIVRFLRFRRGRGGEDAFGVYRSRDVIIDHCSMSWANDEVASLYNNERLTLQYSIIAQGLFPESPEGDGGFGGIWGGAGVSFHHNLLAQNNGRNPRINGYRRGRQYPQPREFVDVSGNVIFNWSWLAAYGNEAGKLNLVGNYFRPGPDSTDSTVQRIFVFYQRKDGLYGQAFVDRNYFDLASPVLFSGSRGLQVVKTPPEEQQGKLDGILVAEPFSADTVTGFKGPIYLEPINGLSAWQQLVEEGDVGANRGSGGWFQDAVDTETIADVAARRSNRLTNELQQISSWEEYDASLRLGEAAVDEDADGMDDNWEQTRGVKRPGRRDLDDRYTNLEVYLNELAAKPSAD